MNWYVIVWEQHADVHIGLSIPGMEKWWADNKPSLGNWSFTLDRDYRDQIRRLIQQRIVRVTVVPQHQAPMIELHGDEDILEESFEWVVEDGNERRNRTIRAMAECESWPEAMKKSREMWNEWVGIIEDENEDEADSGWQNLGSLWERFREEAVKAGYSLPPESERSPKAVAS